MAIVLTIANCFGNGKTCLTEQMFSSPLAWVVDPEIIRPRSRAPHWVQRAGFHQALVDTYVYLSLCQTAG